MINAPGLLVVHYRVGSNEEVPFRQADPNTSNIELLDDDEDIARTVADK